MTTSTEASTPSGLLAGLASLSRNGARLLLCRLELAAIEVSEVRDNLLHLILATALALLALVFAVAYGTMLIVVVSWDRMGWTILLLLCVVFASIATGLFIYAKNILRQEKLSLSSTMAELKADRDMLL